MSTYLWGRKFTLEDLCESLCVMTCLWETQPWKCIICMCHSTCLYENTWSLCIPSWFMYTTWILSDIYAPKLVRVLFLSWRNMCKHSTINFKMMNLRNIAWMSAYATIPERNKHKLFVCRGLQKNNLLIKMWGRKTYIHNIYAK
jgi:hypothetical protein